MGQQVQDCYRQGRCEGNGSFQALPGPAWQEQLCRKAMEECWQPNARAACAGDVARVCSIPTAHPKQEPTGMELPTQQRERGREGIPYSWFGNPTPLTTFNSPVEMWAQQILLIWVPADDSNSWGHLLTKKSVPEVTWGILKWKEKIIKVTIWKWKQDQRGCQIRNTENKL